MQYKKLRASQVRLDPRNPRLPEGTGTENEAVNRLLRENYSGLLALARDLVETGQSNPAELPIVVRDGSKYLVLEGNRRFAALKLLASPSLAEDPAHRAAFTRLGKRGSPPTTVMCAVGPSREAADHWLVLRHTGQNGGVGVRDWNSEQVANHRRRANVAIDAGTARSITIADELEEAYAQDEALVQTLRRVRASKLTNIGRFFSGEVMTRLHLSIRETGDLHTRGATLWATHSTYELHSFFSWAVGFIEQNSVDHYKNGPIRSRLLDRHQDVLPDTTAIDKREAVRLADTPWIRETERMGQDGDDMQEPAGASEPVKVNDPGSDDAATKRDSGGDEPGPHGTGDNPAVGDDGPVGGASSDAEDEPQSDRDVSKRKHEARPEKRLFHELKLPNLEKRTQLLLKEVRKIEHDVDPGIACVMARVLVELAVSDPEVLSWSGARERDILKAKILACLKALDPKCDQGRPDRPELRMAYLDTVSEGGVQYLHAFVHNPQAYPSPEASRQFSHHWRPLLEAIDARTGQENT